MTENVASAFRRNFNAQRSEADVLRVVHQSPPSSELSHHSAATRDHDQQQLRYYRGFSFETIMIIKQSTSFKCQVIPSAGALIRDTMQINSNQTHVTCSLEIELGTHWWGAKTLATAQTLLHCVLRRWESETLK